MTVSAPDLTQASRSEGIAFILKKALISALVALVLFSLMIGIRTEAGPTGQLIYWTRFDDLATIVGVVFVGSIVIELLRQWWGPVRRLPSCRHRCKARSGWRGARLHRCF